MTRRLGLLLLLALACSSAALSTPRLLLEKPAAEVAKPTAEGQAKAKEPAAKLDAVQEAVAQQAAYDAAALKEQHNAAAASALFVGGALLF